MPTRVKRERLEFHGFLFLFVNRCIVARQPLAGKSVCRLSLFSQAVFVCQTAFAANMMPYSGLQTEGAAYSKSVCWLTNSNSDKHPQFKTGVNEKNGALDTM